MMLPGRVTSAPPGLHGIDTSGVLNEEHCQAAKSRGFSFCIRYVSRTARQSASDLSEAEARTILSAGLALMPVQHVAREGWSPTKQLGTTFGKNAAAHVFHIGFPQGVNVWLDLEGIKPSSSHWRRHRLLQCMDCGGGFGRVRSRRLCRREGDSYWRRDFLASSDQTFLEIWKQGSGHTAPRLPADSKDHQRR